MFQLFQRFNIFLAILLLTSSLFANSLWENSKGSLYSSAKKEVQVGDVITIYISESSSAAQEASTRTSKESELGTQFLSGWDQVANLLGNENIRKNYDFSLKGDDSYKGAGQTTRQSKVTAIITAMVTEVLENGNVFIVGERKVKVNNEIETIHISGIVRPADISATNSVFSYQIAKAEVSINGSGVVASKQSPGVLTKMFNWLF